MSEKVLVIEDEQLKIETEADCITAFKGIPPLTYTGPLATNEYHAREKQFTELYLSTDHEQIQQLAKQLVESSVSPDIKVKFCTVLGSFNLRLLVKTMKVLKNCSEMLGRKHQHWSAKMAYCYKEDLKKRLVIAALSNETAFTLNTELLVKCANCLPYINLHFLLRSIENEYKLLLEHAKHMEDYEKHVICNFFTMKLSL